MIYVLVFLAGFTVGVLVAPHAKSRRALRLVRRGYTAPARVELPSHVEQWDLYTVAFAFHANLLHSFSYRDMRAAGVVKRSAWETYLHLLRDAGVVAGGERVGAWWSAGWSYPALRAAVKHGRLALPYPDGSPPQFVSAKLAQTAHATQRSTRDTAQTTP